ncbi:MAG: T9SS type A sorting domain-containing protein [Bacteroidales bacterium]
MNDCGEGEFSEELTILCSVCTGIDESSLEAGVEVYPNPSKGIFNVKFNTNIGETQIRIMNMLNKIVADKTIYSKSGDILPLDISSLSNGIYILSIRAGGSELNKKLIVH